MSRPAQHVVHSGNITATGSSGLFGFGAQNAVFVLDITAAGCTSPTLDVIVEEYDEASDSYATIDTIPQQTGVANVRRTVVGNTTPFGHLLRISWTLGGTASPNFTFTFTAHEKP